MIHRSFSMLIHSRLCIVLAYWLEHHPGDFCGIATNAALRRFIAHLHSWNWTREYILTLESLTPDVEADVDFEAGWAIQDCVWSSDGKLGEISLDRRPSLVPSLSSTSSFPSTTSQFPHSTLASSPAIHHIQDDALLQNLSPGLSNRKRLRDAQRRERGYLDANDIASSEMALLRNSLSSGGSEASRRRVLLEEGSNLTAETPVTVLAQHITMLAQEVFSIVQVSSAKVNLSPASAKAHGSLEISCGTS